MDEISNMKQIHEDLKHDLKQKEATIDHLRAANDNLRVKSIENLRKVEDEKKELALALDEANAKNTENDQQIRALKEEMDSLKEFSLFSQRKRVVEEEKRSKTLKENRQRENTVNNLEEENRKVEEQLKWKNEQFRHLEEAHLKIKDQLRTRKKEWELEKSSLIDEISSLQSKFDSQTRVSEDLQRRLQMCNQALAHEETKRKYLEIQLLESKTCFESLSDEFDQTKTKLESLTLQRDEEIAKLRVFLGEKESFVKEMRYQNDKLEQENRDLMASLKELQEERIKESGSSSSSSVSKLRNKLKNLKAKEREYSQELESKFKIIEELKMEVTHLKFQNEDTSLIIQVLEKEFSFLTKELEMKNDDLDRLNNELDEKFIENNEFEFELQLWKSIVDHLKAKLEENHQIRREVEASLLAQAEVEFMLKEEKDSIFSMLEERERRVKELEEKLLSINQERDCIRISKIDKEIDWFEDEWLRRELEEAIFAQVDAERRHERERESFRQLLEEKEKRICHLQQIVNEFETFSTQLAVNLENSSLLA